MSYSMEKDFNKGNLDDYLRALGKEFRRLNGKKMPAEIILVGGGAVLVSYNFRNATTDIDAIIMSSSAMKEAINNVGNDNSLPHGWLNADFMKTKSYTPKLVEVSTYYKTFSNILTVRTIDAEYLIAMKLMSGREYKKDLSDVLGILAEHKKHEKPISVDDIERAVDELYGKEKLPKSSLRLLEIISKRDDFDVLFAETQEQEMKANKVLTTFEKQNPGILSEDNLDEILRSVSKKKGKQKETKSKER